MAKTQTYTDEILLDAVIGYANSYSGKIMISDLTDWASKNVEGLENVKRYHFERKLQYKNSDTGKIQVKERPCLTRIRELNKIREPIKQDTNPLLSASNMNEIFNYPLTEQKRLVALTREQFAEAKKLIRETQNVNASLNATNKQLKAEIDSINQLIKETVKEQEKNEKLLKRIIKLVSENEVKKAMEEIGITENNLDLVKFTKSMTLTPETMLSFNLMMKESNKNTGFVDEAMKGIDF